METKSKITYQVDSQSKNWSDTATVFYFVTLCTKNSRPYFGPTQMGDIAYRYWIGIPDHFPFVELDAFVITPDHVRGILFLNRPRYESWRTNSFKPQAENLASVVRYYKDSAKKYALSNRIGFDWQPNYTTHVIRSEIELNTIRKYINGN
jgi:putative transposase